jgi:uncharacterized lipoprotein YddW (UPF0748 family)
MILTAYTWTIIFIYPSYNGTADFPDTLSWNAYLKKGGKLSRGDWRRAAVNTLIERMYKNIKAIKPWVKFGLSPFGIWRPAIPKVSAALTNTINFMPMQNCG